MADYDVWNRSPRWKVLRLEERARHMPNMHITIMTDIAPEIGHQYLWAFKFSQKTKDMNQISFIIAGSSSACDNGQQ